jgi:electron transfer flavoprotein alpha subunit
LTMTATKQESEFKGLWVFVEHSDGQLERVSLEILGKATVLARRLNTNVTAALLGHNLGNLAEEIISFGADRVLVADSPYLHDYTTEAFSNVLGQLVSDGKPEILLMGATHNGRDLAGRLAVRLNTGLTAHAVQVELENETNLLLCGVPGFGGSIVAVCKCPHSRPQMATVRPGIFPLPRKDLQRTGTIERVQVNITNLRTKVVERSIKEIVDIAKAEWLVIAGRGAEAHLDEVRKFADSMGAAVGVTRPLADKGLMPRDNQVGSTGSAVAPKVALVLGVSGAAHFVSGIREASLVISVNKDPEATIKNYSDYVVVDDVGDLLSALLSSMQKVEVAQ